MIEESCLAFSDYDKVFFMAEDETEVNKKLVKYTVDNTEQDKEGRLVMLLMWNNRISNFLCKYFI